MYNISELQADAIQRETSAPAVPGVAAHFGVASYWLKAFGDELLSGEYRVHRAVRRRFPQLFRRLA
jgi:hypothetical protein